MAKIQQRSLIQNLYIYIPLQIMLILAICGFYVAHPKSTLMCRLLKYPQIIWYSNNVYILYIYKFIQKLHHWKLGKAATANAARKSSHSFALFVGRNALGIISGLCYIWTKHILVRYIFCAYTDDNNKYKPTGYHPCCYE